MGTINGVLRQLEISQNEAMAKIKNAKAIKDQLLVVSVENEEQLKALKNYAQNHKVTNLLILDGSKTATFIGEESNCLYFTNFFAPGHGPYMLSKDVWEIELGMEDVALAEDIRKKFESRDFYLGEMSSHAFVLNKLDMMRSRFANDIREGFRGGMKEARYVEYKLYCIATILQKHIDETCANTSKRDKMALTLVKQELEELIASGEFQLCQEMYKCGACMVLSHSVQKFVAQMHCLLAEICE